MATTFKQWQMEKNIVDCCYVIERFLTTRCRTIGLLQLLLPIGWKITKQDSDKKRYLERSFETSTSSLNSIFLTLKNNKVRIYNFYPSDFNKDFTTIRLNIVIDEYDKVTLVQS